MTTFSVSWADASAAGTYAQRILQTVQSAANAWASYLQGYGTIEISLSIQSLDAGTIATGGTNFNGTGGSLTPNPISEIRTGTDPDGAEPDIAIEIGSDYYSRLFYDPTGTQAVPAGQIDARTVFEHEIAHGLGFLYLDRTAYAAAVQTIDGSSFFTGPNATIANSGAPVPLASGLGHVSIGDDLMNPAVASGTRKEIGQVDLGILQDIGAPVGTGRADLITLGGNGDTFLAFGGNDTVSGGGGGDVLFGNQGDDVLFGNLGNDTLYGGQDRDTVYGGQDDDVVLGNLGDDVVLGNLGNDTLFGGQGADTLYGGQGNDVLSGDLGNDVLSGDLGADRYVFGQNSGIDLVLGFSQAQGDRLDLSGQTYTLAGAGNGDALLTLSGGGSVELAGITAAQFQTSFLA
ncbi:calcium-binding protein [Methylobacterium trifolii]|uniref:Calcium-binding protein n=1 Tax=Methylobacterium trifolii TaxID=1003092 RepID=A0ABQ4U2W4_9HYPH|nr:calcium-binding protein [Methylobacterium trifolii]GJE61182.1 hypothetical protein MPOCJGCO_3303 [Methylobacterium trifolii]